MFLQKAIYSLKIIQNNLNTSRIVCSQVHKDNINQNNFKIQLVSPFIGSKMSPEKLRNRNLEYRRFGSGFH